MIAPLTNERREMRVSLGLVLAVTVFMLCGCVSMGRRGGSLAIDFHELSIAGVRPGDPEEKVIEGVGHPYEIRYGRADSPREIWPYYDLGLEVVVDKKSREVEKMIVFLNRYQAYSPFRGRIVQDFPLASRLVQVKPKLEGYKEIEVEHPGYVKVHIYTDDVETAKVDEEDVYLERSNGAKMTIYFDYDKWMERVELEGKGSGETVGPPPQEQEVVIEEPEAEEAE